MFASPKAIKNGNMKAVDEVKSSPLDAIAGKIEHMFSTIGSYIIATMRVKTSDENLDSSADLDSTNPSTQA